MAEPPPQRTAKQAPPEPVDQTVETSGVDTREIQSLLTSLGLYQGEADGVATPALSSAVGAFQSANGLPADGKAGPQTLARLREEAAKAPISRVVETPTAGGATAGGNAPTVNVDVTGTTARIDAGSSVSGVSPDPASEGTARSYLPRFSADSLNGRDLLERRDRIEFIASVLAAKELETPLAIGLFGDWGSGKSFFMRRLQERIAKLTDASAVAVEARGASLYCSRVRHVMFNAWLHSDSEIWPAFAAEVFRGVGEESTSTPQGEEQRKSLLAYQDWVREDAERLRTDAERQQRIVEINKELAETQEGRTGLVPDVGGPIGKSVGTVYELGARVLGLREGWRGLGLLDVLLLLVVVALAVCAYTFLDWPLTVVTVVGTGALGGLRYLDGVARIRRHEQELRTELNEQEQALQAGDAPVSPGLLLPEFALREASDWAQRAQLGTVTQIRMRFEQLSRLLAQGVEARTKEGKLPPDAVPVERVIVYVDDLDRCQPDVVVSVLETLKLLLDLPHFVAVVGVDSRWLFRSLQLHFRELLGTDDEVADDAWAATPQNYLEKIFQYSLVLRPITASGFANLIEELLAPPATVGSDEARPGHEAPATGSQEAATADDASPTPPADTPTPSPPPAVDLNPAELVISREEVDFAKGLAPLFETPRAAKRLANVYRLLRVSVGADEVMRDESYETVLLLLAIGIAFPGLAFDVFAEIDYSQRITWPDFVDALPYAIRGDERLEGVWRLERMAADDPDRPALEEELNQLAPDADVRVSLQSALRRSSYRDVEDRTLASFAQWIPVVSEFSFHPWQEALPPETQS